MLIARPALALLVACAAGAAAAQVLPPPQNVIGLNVSATMEVPKDQLTVAFSTSREGADAGAVQGQLKQAVDAALAEVRKAVKPGQIEVQTGNFSLFPRYSSKGGITGWMGSAEVIVDGKDITGIAQLTGRVSTMTIARVSFSLSREARDKVDADVTAQAISKFRAKADQVTRQFGFAAYTIREVTLSTNEPPSGVVPMMRMQSAKIASDEALPVEAGKANVTASVSGNVQMGPPR